MQEQTSEQELKERLRLIEKMIAEGRRNTESRGWRFTLWGVVFYVALAWSTWGHSVWAWPVTVTLGIIATFAGAAREGGSDRETTLGRAIGSIWMAVGISMFLLFTTLGFSGRLADEHLFVALISAMLGIANGASALILRWKVQFICAAAWWVAVVTACFGTDAQNTIGFLAAIFVCQIAFGLYGMITDAQQRKRRAPAHA